MNTDTGIDVLDNPNTNPAIQAQLVKAAIDHHEKRVRDWRACPKRESRAIRQLVAEYANRIQRLKSSLL